MFAMLLLDRNLDDFSRKRMSGRFKTYKADNMFVRAYHLAYYAYISYAYEKYRICIYPKGTIGNRYDITFEQIAEMYDIVNCIKNKEYSKKMNSKKRKWLKIF